MNGSHKERRLCSLCPPTGGPAGGPAEGYVDKAISYVRTMPVVGPLVTQLFPGEQLSNLANETMLRLADDSEWIQAFRDPTIFTALQTPAAPSGTFGPKEVLLHLPPAERIRSFEQFSLRFIPQDVRDRHNIGTNFADIQRRGNLGTLQQALGAVFGSEVPAVGSPAHRLAVESLNQHYQIDPATPALSNTLRSDSRRDFEWHRQRGRVLTSYSAAPPPIGGVPPPLSPFRGAIRLGIFNPAIMEELQKVSDGYQSERARVTTDAAGELNRLGAVREAMGMRDVWQNLGGGEKLVLLITAFMLLRSDKGKPLLFAGVAAYFAHKFWSRGGNMFDAIDQARGQGSPIEENANHVREIEDVLGESIIGRNSPEVVGAGLLRVVPLTALATSFAQGPSGQWSIDANLLNTQLNRIPQSDANYADIQHNRSRILQWLGSADNNRAASSMLSYVFFDIASSNPANESLRARVQAAVPTLGQNQNYFDLTGDARRAFDTMVSLGKERALGTNLSLGKHFQQRAALIRGSGGVGGLETLLPGESNAALRRSLEELGRSGYTFRQLRPAGIAGEYILVEFPSVATSGVRALNVRPSFVLDTSRFRTALQAYGTGNRAAFENSVRTGQLNLMGEAEVAQDILRVGNDINLPGSPVLLDTIRYDAASQSVRARVVVGGGDIGVPFNQWLHWRMVEELSPGQIVSRMMLERSPGVVAVVGGAVPVGRIDVPPAERGTWTEDMLSRLLVDSSRYRNGVRRAIYETQVRAGAPNVRGEFERAKALAGGAASLQAVEAIPGVSMVTLRFLAEGGREGFVPVYNLRLRKANGTVVDVRDFSDRLGFIDRDNI
ncbi:hypothetical protein HYZ98_01165 [Candidatus Peregrinibacteria bacterium]|nr:hypothetical protein [Candidatus Peregrinibacteria bacterium]